jgi:hypothetical protein
MSQTGFQPASTVETFSTSRIGSFKGASTPERRYVMARFKMDSGGIVDTENATKGWKERQRHDGQNWISLATGSQWEHETLYRSRKGRYWKEHRSQYQGSTPYAEWVSNRDALAWLLVNEYDGSEIPEELRKIEEEVSE